MTRTRRRVLIALGLAAVLLAGGVAVLTWMRSEAEYSAGVESYEITGDSAALRLRVSLNEGDSIVRGEASESSEKVVVHVIARHPLNWSGGDVGIARYVRVDLRQPLGDRDVVDAVSDQPVPRT